jgi:hypothetical protein
VLRRFIRFDSLLVAQNMLSHRVWLTRCH